MPRQLRPPLTQKQIDALAAGRAKGRAMVKSGELVYGGRGGGGRRVREGSTEQPAGPAPTVVPDSTPAPLGPAAAPKSRRITWPKEAPAPPPAEPEPGATAEPDDEAAPVPEREPSSSPEPETPAPSGGFLAGLLEAFK